MTDIKEAHGLEIFTVPDWYLADCRKNPRDKDVVLLSDATAVIDQLRAELQSERDTESLTVAELRERVAELEYAAELDRTADLYAAPQPAAQDRWIPVSERLPEIATDVLVYGVNHGSASYTVAGLFSGSWGSQETEETTRFEPTHWMPLPAVPEVRS